MYTKEAIEFVAKLNIGIQLFLDKKLEREGRLDINQAGALLHGCFKWFHFKDVKPPDGVEVLAYSSEWVHPDFNIYGTRIGHYNEGMGFASAKYDDGGYTSDFDSLPEQWKFNQVPEKNKEAQEFKEFEVKPSLTVRIPRVMPLTGTPFPYIIRPVE